VTLRKFWAQMLEPEQVRALLLGAFPEAELELVDLTGTKDHYQARIVSSLFEGKSLLEQHQLVYRALGSAMHGPIHALALKTYTPAAWRKIEGET
jgi:stress-induced morphogen